MAVRVKSGSPTNISPDIEEAHSTKAKPTYSSCPSGITTINPNPGGALPGAPRIHSRVSYQFPEWQEEHGSQSQEW